MSVIAKYEKPKSDLRLTIVIDAFRAFATAGYVLEHNPTSYLLTNKCSVISRLSLNLTNPITIGKPEKSSDLIYDIPNSPTRVLGLEVNGRNVLHRTEAGAKGIISAQDADTILAVGFINADATVKYIKTLSNPHITILPMGHEGTTPSLEDQICAKYIESLIYGTKIEISSYLHELRKGPGRYFFSKDQWQYPQADFERCLELRRFNFAIKAVVKNDYAILSRCD